MIKNIFIISLIFSYITYGELKLPSIFSDGMILQRNKELIIWGKAEPFSKVQLFLMNKHLRLNQIMMVILVLFWKK